MSIDGKVYLINGSIVDFDSRQIEFELTHNLNLNNKIIHNSKGPAVIWKFDFLDKYWHVDNGRLHRLDGPAMYNDDIYYEFAINGFFFNEIDFAIKTKHLVCNCCQHFCKQRCF